VWLVSVVAQRRPERPVPVPEPPEPLSGRPLPDPLPPALRPQGLPLPGLPPPGLPRPGLPRPRLPQPGLPPSVSLPVGPPLSAELRPPDRLPPDPRPASPLLRGLVVRSVPRALPGSAVLSPARVRREAQ
jgi:hypothetical protein